MYMETKKCNKCNEFKPLAEFNRNKTRKDGLHTYCKKCNKEVSANYYKNNKEKHLKEVLKVSKKVRNENKKKYFEILNSGECMDCGFSHPAALVFDHKSGVNKIAGIGRMVTTGYKWETILKEIDKCDLVCANCHAIRTAKQQNWYNFNQK